jgi:hypothetical protein
LDEPIDTEIIQAEHIGGFGDRISPPSPSLLSRNNNYEPRGSGSHQFIQMAGSGWRDSLHGLALAQEGLAKNCQHRWQAISHPRIN